MFVIFGITPKTVLLPEPAQRCQVCGRAQAQAKRVDQYFSLFFIPLFRVRQGAPFVECNHCHHSSSVGNEAPFENGRSDRCPTCRQPVQADFRFCPYCGRRR